jgi:toxin-antitoxin system PIN domain toxin
LTALLDVNVLVALAWPNHVHHDRAQAWFEATHGDGWATCPLTESGFVRVSSNSRAIPEARSPAEAVDLLRHVRAVPGHEFWQDDVSPTDEASEPFEHAVGYRQVTDAHLLSLAIRRGGTLATFDRGIESLAPDTHRTRVDLIG